MPVRKILVIHLKYLGDLVLATAALRSLKAFFPEAELHVATAAEAAPLVQHVGWLARVWPVPRARGKVNARAYLPVVRAMRAERFDVSIDLVGNDRGALLSRLVGARERIGAVAAHGFFWRRQAYTRPVEEFDFTRHEALRYWATVSALGVPYPDELRTEIAPDPALRDAAGAYLAGTEVLCFVSASQEKKEWPLESWVAFHRQVAHDGVRVAFTGGNGPREAERLAALRGLAPDLPILPPAEPLPLLVAALARLRGFVGVDTGALHFAAALGAPTIGLFGPTLGQKWAPLGAAHRVLQGALCPCSGYAQTCTSADFCMRGITPEALRDAFRSMPLRRD